VQDDAPERPEDAKGEPREEPKQGMQLYTKILIGLVAGSIAALVVKATLVGEGRPLTQEELELFGTRWIQPVGDFFIRAIILTVVPLVFASLTNGIFKLGDVRALGRMGGRTMLIFLSTALAGAIIATLLYEVTQPGGNLSEETRQLLATQFQGKVDDAEKAAGTAAEHFGGSLFEVLLSLVPKNIVDAATSNRDLLKVILFSCLFGTALTMIERSKAEPVAKFVEGLYEVMIKIIGILMKLAPYGVFALVFMVVVRFGPDVLYALALYTMVVLAGLALHLALVLLPVVRVFGGWQPAAFLRATKDIWITAFSTSSSSATLPTTMQVAEEKLGVPRPIASFVLPLGSTVNMDGTTIYQVIAVHFVAQVWGVPMDLTASITLVLVAMLMAIGAAGVPGGVIPLLYVVMATVGIPDDAIPQGIALILGMDRILDMCRSALNVIGDTATASIVAKQEAKAASS
jgi:DAACS family dicarboxylate/amino acid:cation (Na+ or H+) symporter